MSQGLAGVRKAETLRRKPFEMRAVCASERQYGSVRGYQATGIPTAANGAHRVAGMKKPQVVARAIAFGELNGSS